MTQAISTAPTCSPSDPRRAALLTSLLTLFRAPRPSLPLLDPDALSDHWRRDLGLAGGRPEPRPDSFWR